jgi:hypothetical protein
MPEVILISKPQFDLSTILALSNEMLGYSPARAADAAGLKDQPHLMACLAAFRDKHATATVRGSRDVYDLLHFGFLFASDMEDMAPILEILGGMPFALTDTRVRGIQAAIVVGTFYHWRLAVLRGCRSDQPDFIRVCFDKVFNLFQGIGLADAFGKLTKKQMPDRTFYLEDQR